MDVAKLPQREVLLIDDDGLVLQTYTTLLRRASLDVLAVTSGLDALRAIREAQFQVVLADVSMPSMDGIELCREIRKIDPDVPLLLITGAPNLESAMHAVELGVMRYLLKSKDEPRLVEYVRSAAQLGRMARIKREALALGAPSAESLGGLIAMRETWGRAVDALWMAWQPIVSVSRKKIFGFEALARTREPSVPNPGILFDMAERLDSVKALGQRIRELIPPQVGAFDDDAAIFVNLHPEDLLADSLFDPDTSLGRIAQRVVLEITERASLHHVGDLSSRIERLRQIGYRIAVDDLGAGYAGLSSFVSLTPQVVKIDMSLVRDIDSSTVKRKIVQSLVQLCVEMGLLVVAEGVETVAEMTVLRELGCDLLQGYLLARPGPPVPIVRWPAE